MSSFKQISIPVLLITWLSSFLSDLLNILSQFLISYPYINYELRQALHIFQLVPFHGLLFGLLFGFTSALCLNDRFNINFADIIGLTLVCSLVDFFMPKVISYASLFLTVSHLNAYLIFIVYGLKTLIIALGIKSILRIEISDIGLILAVALGLLASLPIQIPIIQLQVGMFYYTIVGLSFALFAAKTASIDYGLLKDEY